MLGVPPFFKEIFEHLPNSLSDLISWREMLGEVTSLSNRMITKKGVTEAKSKIIPLLGIDIEIVNELPDELLNVSNGEQILKLYFLQIMKAQKMFLDLRPKRFANNKGKLSWNPNGLWAELDGNFAEGIRMVYEGYYKNNDVLFSTGLEKSRLIKNDWSDEKKQEVIEVFKTHFSNGRGEKVAFTMEGFQKSFTEIFKTLVKNKIKLDKNFLYLGIMLVTLYASLSEIDESFDVSKIFNQI
ncbi:MAG: hypothetical protein H7336_13405 [Bacteriovorax sp.]|nr:hypothetical protein [Bacteriovorax sp.]